jgi:spermidine/putrescine-binding protein
MRRESGRHQGDLSRRDLLKRGGSLALASIGVGALPRWALGANTLPSPLRLLAGPSATKPEYLKPFEEKYGVKLELAPYGSPTDTINKILAPGGTRLLDLASTTSEFVGPLIERGAILPLDFEKIPNTKYLHPVADRYIERKDGKPYNLPHYWGYNTVLYNTKVLSPDDPATQSWKLLFDEKNKGRVALRDNAYESILMTATYLGYPDPTRLTRKDLKEVTKFLVSKKPLFRALWTGFAQAVGLMASGEVDAMFGWILMRTTLQQQGHPVRNNWPKEGILYWAHTYFVPKDTPVLPTVYAWLNYVLSEEYAVAMMRGSGILSTSTLVRKRIPESELKELGFDLTERGLRLVQLGLPDNLNDWLQAWAEFKSA